MANKKICSVVDCNNDSLRSLAFARVERAGLNIAVSKRVYLCKIHYKEFKKSIKSEQQVKKWREHAPVKQKFFTHLK